MPVIISSDQKQTNQKIQGKIDFTNRLWVESVISRSYSLIKLLLKSGSLDKIRINMDDFIETYSMNEVCSDIHRVAHLGRLMISENRENDFESLELMKKTSEAFEIVFCYLSKKYKWLGDNICFTKTSPYDDFCGIDGVLEFYEKQNQESYYLGIDLTFSETRYISKKILGVKDYLNNFSKIKIKYYFSSLTKKQGQIFNIPKALFFCSFNKVILTLYYFTLLCSQNEWTREFADQYFKKDFLQNLFLEEIIVQLSYFIKYKEKIKKLDDINKYTFLLNELCRVYETSKQKSNFVFYERSFERGDFSKFGLKLKNFLFS